MNKYQAHINIMPLKELLDPQGKAVVGGLHNLKLDQIENVRIGKHIMLEINAENETAANALATEACEKLLSNKVMESYSIQVSTI